MKKLFLFILLVLASTGWAADTDVDTDANGAIDVAFGGTNKTALSADVITLLGQANTAAIKAQLSVDDLVALSGVADGAVNLGSFTGSTIADNQTVKAALQALETAVEGKQATMTAASQAEMEAGTEAAIRSMSPLRVAQAIAALAGTGSGTVTAVGDCASGDCLDGTADGGTYIRLYDGNSHYTQIAAGDSAGNLTFTLPTAAPGNNDAIMVMATTGVISTRAATVYQTADTELGQIAALSPAQGDVLYYNGAAWVLLTAGVNGQYLKTQGAGANPMWGDPAGSGDMTAVGNFTSGAAFTEADTQNGILYFEGTTNNDFEIALTARNATADRTVYLPDSDGDVVVGPANGFGTDLRLIKTNGTGSLTQITGITVDGSNNVTGIVGITPTYIAFGADPADAGVVRMNNGVYIMSEANPAGTDISLIGTDASNVIQIGAVGAGAGVTITPATTITGALTLGGSILTGNRAFTIGDAATDSITFTTDGTGNAEIVLPNDSIGDAEVDWGSGAGQIDLDDVPDGSTYQRVAATDVDANSHVNLVQDSDGTGAVQFTGLGATRAITLDDAAQELAARNRANTFTENNTFGNADTDTLTLRSLLVGGNSRAVWIAGSAPTPTYATGTNELYVAGDIETPGTVYANSFIATGTGDSYIDLNSNASTPVGAGTNSLYVVANAWKIAENGTEKDLITASDSVTWTGATHSFAGVTSMVLPTATPDANGEIGINNTNETLLLYINGGLKTLDFSGDSSGYVLKSNGSGTFTLAADETAGSPTLNTVGNPTGDTTIAMDANEEVNFQYTGNFTTGTQFLIQQLTGNPSGGVLFEVRGADPDPALARFGDGTNYVQISNTGGMTLAGTGSITAGGIILGDSSPDANGEIGYASNAFNWYANSEDMVATAGANLWTFSSNTSATFAFTPAVAFTGTTTHNAGVIVGNGATGPGFIRLMEDSDNGTDYSTITGAADAGTYPSFTFSGSQGSENLTLAVTASNTWTVSSSTGVTDISLGSINMATTGTIQGALKINSDSNGMTQGEMTTAGMYGTFYVATGAGTWNLPAAAAGMNVCVYSTTAAAIVINPDNSDVITLNGTALSAGDSITSASAAGDFICIVAVSDSSWLTLGRSGTWTDTN